MHYLHCFFFIFLLNSNDIFMANFNCFFLWLGRSNSFPSWIYPIFEFRAHSVTIEKTYQPRIEFFVVISHLMNYSLSHTNHKRRNALNFQTADEDFPLRGDRQWQVAIVVIQFWFSRILVSGAYGKPSSGLILKRSWPVRLHTYFYPERE